MFQFAKALCDLGASINLMPYAIFKKLGIGDPKSTTMCFVIADHSIKRPMYFVLFRLWDILLFLVDSSPCCLSNKCLVVIYCFPFLDCLSVNFGRVRLYIRVSVVINIDDLNSALNE